MKKFLLGIILPVLTLVTLIGTGFATWYFGDSQVAGTVNDVTVQVEAYEQLGDWTVIQPTTATLVLDQPTTTDGIDNVKLMDGVKAGTITATYNKDANAANKEVKLTCTITIPANLAKYVVLDSAKFTTASTSGVGGDAVYTVDMTAKNITSLTIDTASFKYVKAMVPKNKTDYQTMKEAVSGQKVKVAFKAEIVKQAA